MKQKSLSTLMLLFHVMLCGNILTVEALVPSNIRSNNNGIERALSSYQLQRQHPIITTKSTTQRPKRKDTIARNMMLGGMEGDAMVSSVTDLLQSSGMLLSHEHVEIYDGPFASILDSATLWSCAVALSIVGLLLSWEEGIKASRRTLPPALQPVLDSMLGEMGGIGFIGLFLSVFVTGGILGEVVEELSEKFLGDGEILLETFEFLHTSFFEVGIGFFTISGLIVAAVLRRIEKLEEVSLLAIDTDGDGVVTLDELADALGAESLTVDLDGDGVLSEDEITLALQKAQRSATMDELFMGDKERGAECLLLRERLLPQAPDPDNFIVETYFEQIFGHNLEEIVELSPITWLPLIPLISIDQSVLLSRGVVSASSQNAADTCGLFFSNPFVLGSNVALQAVCLVWGAYNFWKMASIKSMLLPTLLRDGGPDGPARLLPPRVEDKKLRRLFRSTPKIFEPIEQLFHKQATNQHERLFGVVGANGPDFFRTSIKNHIWICVAQIIFYGGQIVAKDAGVLILGDAPAAVAPDVMSEFMLYGAFVTLTIVQLSLAPTTFLNYCVITSVEQLTKKWAMDKATVSNECILDPSWLVQNDALPIPKKTSVQLQNNANGMKSVAELASSEPLMSTNSEENIQDQTFANMTMQTSDI